MSRFFILWYSKFEFRPAKFNAVSRFYHASGWHVCILLQFYESILDLFLHSFQDSSRTMFEYLGFSKFSSGQAPSPSSLLALFLYVILFNILF